MCTLPLLACGGGSETAAPAACAVPSPAISQFTATPASILTGQSVSLSWSVTGADQVTTSPSIGALGSTGATARPGRLSFYDNGGGDHSWANGTLPDLTQTASGDAGDTPPSNRIAPFALLPAGNKDMMFIDDVLATHESLGLVNTTLPQFHPWVSSTGLAFMDAYVQGLSAARAYPTTANLNLVSAGKATLSAR